MTKTKNTNEMRSATRFSPYAPPFRRSEHTQQNEIGASQAALVSCHILGVGPSSEPNSQAVAVVSRGSKKLENSRVEAKQPSMAIVDVGNANRAQTSISHPSHREDRDAQIHNTVPHQDGDLAIRVFESEDMQRQYELYLANDLQKLDRLRKEIIRNKIAHIHQLSTRIDELLSCPICEDIFTAPLVIHTVGCGHTFCAKCLLSWFFKKFDPVLGSWTSAVECPTCRRAMATPQVGETNAFPALPFAPNETLHILTYDLCTTLSARVDDILPNVEVDDIPDAVKRALEWGENGEAQKQWKEKLRYWRREAYHVTDNWGDFTIDELEDLRNEYMESLI